MNLARKIGKNKEKIKLEEMKKTYGKKPKIKCPKCKKKSLFITNNIGEVYCVRCDSRVAINNN